VLQVPIPIVLLPIVPPVLITHILGMLPLIVLIAHMVNSHCRVHQHVLIALLVPITTHRSLIVLNVIQTVIRVLEPLVALPVTLVHHLFQDPILVQLVQPANTLILR
jgi:hypothetical protein